MNRYKDWYEQSKEDIKHAKNSLEVGDYSWGCFAAQQAAEKALKALHMKFGQIAWGHSIVELIENLPEEKKPPQEFLTKAKKLDKYYIPPRYPNAHPAGPAYKYYTKEETEEAIILAEEILSYCGTHIQN